MLSQESFERSLFDDCGRFDRPSVRQCVGQEILELVVIESCELSITRTSSLAARGGRGLARGGRGTWDLSALAPTTAVIVRVFR